jgi:hypothetical protein
MIKAKLYLDYSDDEGRKFTQNVGKYLRVDMKYVSQKIRIFKTPLREHATSHVTSTDSLYSRNNFE